MCPFTEGASSGSSDGPRAPADFAEAGTGVPGSGGSRRAQVDDAETEELLGDGLSFSAGHEGAVGSSVSAGGAASKEVDYVRFQKSNLRSTAPTADRKSSRISSSIKISFSEFGFLLIKSSTGNA